MEAKKMYFMDCHLAGRMYHDADGQGCIYYGTVRSTWNSSTKTWTLTK